VSLIFSHARRIPVASTHSQTSATIRLQSRVDITNMFTQSFYVRRSQKRKMANDFTVIFALLGYTNVKAGHKMLMKLRRMIWIRISTFFL
jgi:hypothetical protein